MQLRDIMKRIALILAFASIAYAAGPPAPYFPKPHVVYDEATGGIAVTMQPTSYGAMLVSPAGTGTDWTPMEGTASVAVQPNNYVGLLVCTANCSSAYGQTWGPWNGSGGGGGGAPTGPAGGDLSGAYPNPTLANSGATAGTYLFPLQTVDAKGRITSVSGVVTRPWQFMGFGDSYVQGYGSTISGKGQFSLLAADSPSMVPPINYGVGGTWTPQIAMSVFANWVPHPTYPSVAIIDGGNNDYTVDSCGHIAGTNCIKNWNMSMGAAASWLANAPQNRLFASQATATGTWTTSNTVAVNSLSGATAGTGLQSVVSGSTLTFTIPATNNGNVELFQSTQNANTGTYTVAIGPTGSPVAQTDAECSGTTTFSSGPCGGTAMPFSLSPQRHAWFNSAWAGQSLQVVITTTNTGTNAFVGAGYMTTTAPSNLNVVMLQDSSTSYDINGIYSAAAATLVTQLAATGEKVILAPIRAALAALPNNGVSTTSTSTCTGSTLANHPNDCGQIAEAQATETAAQTAGVQFWQYGAGGQLPANSGVLNAPLSVASCDTTASNLTCRNTLNRKGNVLGSVILSFFDNGNSDTAGVHWGRAATMPDGTTNQYYISLYGSAGSGPYACIEPQTASGYASMYLLTGWSPTWCVKTATGEMVSKSSVTATQFIASGSVPTIAPGPAAGTGATASITGANMAGRISITTGTSTTASATLATITFSGTVATAPQGCNLQAVGANANGQVGMVAPGGYPTTTGWTIAVAGAAIPASTTYTYSYNCQ